MLSESEVFGRVTFARVRDEVLDHVRREERAPFVCVEEVSAVGPRHLEWLCLAQACRHHAKVDEAIGWRDQLGFVGASPELTERERPAAARASKAVDLL